MMSHPMQRTLLILFTAVVVNAHGASFDCGKAKTTVEKLICTNAEVSKLDDQLNEEYEDAIAQSSEDNPPLLTSQQRAWLASRNTCTNVICLRQSYETRIRELVCSSRYAGSSMGALRCYGLKLIEAERRLAAIEQLYAKRVVAESNNPDYAKEVTADERKKWLAYRDAYCALVGETEGGSDGWKNAWSASCAVDETEKRVASFSQKLQIKK